MNKTLSKHCNTCVYYLFRNKILFRNCSNDINENKLKTKNGYFTSNEGFVRTSPCQHVTVPMNSISNYVWENINKWQNKIALISIETGRKYTYAQLRDHSAALALRLQKYFKLQEKSVVAICLPNIPEYPIAILGAIEAGLLVTTINPNYTSEEISKQLLNSDTKFLIGLLENYKILQNACKLAKKDIPIICIRNTKDEILPEKILDFFQLIDPTDCDFSILKQYENSIDDTVILPFSSGTTGLPKAVQLSHKNIIINCEMLQKTYPYPPTVVEATETYRDISPCILPIFHIYGLTCGVINKLRLGGKLITLAKFTPESLIKSVYDYKSNSIYVVPPMVHFLTNSSHVSDKHFETVNIMCSGAAPIGHKDVERLINKFPKINFLQGYGLTETSPAVLQSHIGCKKYASVGLLVSNTEAKIVSYDGKENLGLDVDQLGEIWVRGPQVMKGYLNNEKATKETLVEGGWLKTGDIGYYDKDGYFFITDRIKELIKVKGYQVPPAELEEVLRTFPDILDAAVIGIPHQTYGEIPRAYVVLKNGSKATESLIKNYVAERVTEYKRLEGGIGFVNEIPKTASGKILRREFKTKR